MSTATQDKTPTHKERFVACIAEDILSGVYEVGERLPSERELAAAMGMSKTVVHSGLERLAQMGLIDIKPQSGVYVAHYIQTGNIETLNAIVEFQGNKLSYELDVAILDLRMAIEGTALRLLAMRRTPEDIARLRALTQEMRDIGTEIGPEGDPIQKDMSERFFIWHREVCILSRSSILPLFMNTVHDISLPFWERYLRQVGLVNALALLDRFTDLLEAGDGLGACELMQEGIDTYLRYLGDA